MKNQNNLLSLLGGSYSRDKLKLAAWHNATPIGDGSEERIDCDGRIIRWSDYGQLSLYGWQIDHIVEQVLGGPDIPSNVRARHHHGNASAGGRLGNALANVLGQGNRHFVDSRFSLDLLQRK